MARTKTSKKQSAQKVALKQGSAVIKISDPTFGIRFLGCSEPCVYHSVDEAVESAHYFTDTKQIDQWEVFELIGTEWVARAAGSTHADPSVWFERAVRYQEWNQSFPG
jgi:hypothetical protein